MADDNMRDPLATLLGYQLRRLSVLVMADLAEALAPLDLRSAEATMLFLIAAQPGLTQSDLGRTLGIQRANMAPLIAGLDQRGLLDRAKLDGRSQSLRLTDAGAALCRQAWERVQDHEARLFADLSPGERSRWATQLRDLWETLGAREPAG